MRIRLSQDLVFGSNPVCGGVEGRVAALEEGGTRERCLDVGYDTDAFQRLAAGRDVVGHRELETVAVGKPFDHGRQRAPGVLVPKIRASFKSCMPPAMISDVDIEISSTSTATGFL